MSLLDISSRYTYTGFYYAQNFTLGVSLTSYQQRNNRMAVIKYNSVQQNRIYIYQKSYTLVYRRKYLFRQSQI